MKSPHKIILGKDLNIERFMDEALHKVYDKNSELAKKADEIHHSRLMDGPACSQCIAMALMQSNKKLKITIELCDGVP